MNEECFESRPTVRNNAVAAAVHHRRKKNRLPPKWRRQKGDRPTDRPGVVRLIGRQFSLALCDIMEKSEKPAN